MKLVSFLFLFLLVINFSVFAQAEDENFYLNDDKITWQKSYPTEKTMEEIFTYFKESNTFKRVKIIDSTVVGKLNRYFVDVKKVGPIGVPLIVKKNDFSGEVKIVYRKKENDYLVSLSNLVFVGRGDFLKKNEEKPFEEQFVRMGYNEYRLGFLRRPKEVLNITISPLFEIK